MRLDVIQGADEGISGIINLIASQAVPYPS